MTAAGASAAEVITLLLAAERHASDEGTGAAVFHGSTANLLGIVFLQEGVICWAVAAGMGYRLTDLLIDESEITVGREAMRRLYFHCLREGVSLGETLVEKRFLSELGLRRALLRHTAESLLELGSAPRYRETWSPHSGSGYAPRYRFSSAEILSQVGTLVAPDLAWRARQQLEPMVAAGATGVAFTREPVSDVRVPVCQLGPGGWTTTQLLALGSWAERAMTLAGLLDPARELLVRGTKAEATAAWQDDELTYIAVARGQGALSDLLATSERASWQRHEVSKPVPASLDELSLSP